MLQGVVNNLLLAQLVAARVTQMGDGQGAAQKEEQGPRALKHPLEGLSKGSLENAMEYRQVEEAQNSSPAAEPEEYFCQTCAQRRYKDGSNDSGVSFKTPGGINAALSGVAVAAHEGEHVNRESGRARDEGSIVTGKKVTFQTAICPDCNRVYVAGGKTSINEVKRNQAVEAWKVRDKLGACAQKMDVEM